jgi:DNA-binding NtrC family response regulator
MVRRVLIVEDGPFSREARLDQFLPAEAGFICEHLRWDGNARPKLESAEVRLIVVVALSEPTTAQALFESLRQYTLRATVFAVVPERAKESLLRAAAEVANDFVVWPLREGELRQRLDRLLGSQERDWQGAFARLSQEAGLSQLIGADPSFLDTVKQIPAIAASDLPVLIGGETGTGKELCAHAIHHLSRRAPFPFIPVECGAVPDLLAENELFGHARGAYTDAHRDQKGLAALAEGGTLFLDEIDSLSLGSQAKLLRFLQDGAYRALGAERFVKANVRVIAAANRDLQSLVREKQFRSDLYFRLNVIELQLPPLRARRGDIGPLARHFLDFFCAAGGGRPRHFSPAALRILEQHDWPGNVRELRNVVQRAVIFSSGASILSSHIAMPVRPQDPAPANGSFRQARQQAIDRFERIYVEQVLREHRGNITRAALAAGKDRRAFGRLVKKHGVNPRAL